MAKITENNPDTLDDTVARIFKEIEDTFWTSYPAKIVEVIDANNVTIQIMIKKSTLNEQDNTSSEDDMPFIADVPVYMLRGGGFIITLPVKVGDVGIAMFLNRNIDDYMATGEARVPELRRRFDINDAFFQPILSPRSNPVTDVSEDSIVIRSEDNLTSITLNETGITIKSPTKITLDSPLVEATGIIAASSFSGLSGEPMKADEIGADVVKVADKDVGEHMVGHTHTTIAIGSQTSVPT